MGITRKVEILLSHSVTTFWLRHNLLPFKWCEKISTQPSEISGLLKDGQTNIHNVKWSGRPQVWSNDLVQANVKLRFCFESLAVIKTYTTQHIHSWCFICSQPRLWNKYLLPHVFSHTKPYNFSSAQVCKRWANQAQFDHNPSTFAKIALQSSLFITLFERKITFLIVLVD